MREHPRGPHAAAMTAWILLLALTALFALALRRGHRREGPRLPAGHERERQLAELRGLTHARTDVRLP